MEIVAVMAVTSFSMVLGIRQPVRGRFSLSAASRGTGGGGRRGGRRRRMGGPPLGVRASVAAPPERAEKPPPAPDTGLNGRTDVERDVLCA